jgi:hypothetical protein
MFNYQSQQLVDHTDLHTYNNLSGNIVKLNISIIGTKSKKMEMKNIPPGVVGD